MHEILLAIPDGPVQPNHNSNQASNALTNHPIGPSLKDDQNLTPKTTLTDSAPTTPTQAIAAPVQSFNPIDILAPPRPLPADESILPASTRKRSFAYILPSQPSTSSDTSASHSGQKQLFNSNRLINDQVDRLGRIYRRELGNPSDKTGFQLFNDDALHFKAQIDKVEDKISDLRARIRRRETKQRRW